VLNAAARTRAAVAAGLAPAVGLPTIRAMPGLEKLQPLAVPAGGCNIIHRELDGHCDDCLKRWC